MRLHLHPELLQRLAAAYALGTLRGGARRRFAAQARSHVAIRDAVHLWEARLAALTELQSVQAPPDIVWRRIETQIQQDLAWRQAAVGATPSPAPTPAPSRPGIRGVSLRWPQLGLGSLVGAVLMASIGWGWHQREVQNHGEQLQSLRQQVLAQADLAQQAQAQLRNTTRVGYVAVLNDDKAAAEWLVTFDADKQSLTLKRVGRYREADEKSLQLWSIAAGGKPISLGVMSREALARFTAAPERVSEQRILAISLEPLGGVPSEVGPTGPVLFKGAVLKAES